MNRSFLLLPLLPLAATLAGCGGAADSAQNNAADQPSVQVTTQAPKRGSLPAIVNAYGAATPSTLGAQTISIAQPGQVTELKVTAGAAVHAGQALATFVTAPTARSAYLQATNALTAARKQRATTAQLLTQQLATTDQLAQADKAVADAQDAVTALGAEGAGATTRTLSAPYDGVVTIINVAPGDRTQPGAPLITVARTTGIVVTVGVDVDERGRVKPGQPATLQRLAGGAPLAGHVVRVDSQLNARTRLIDADIAFPAGQLLPGEGMSAAIDTGQTAGWVVPHVSIVTANGPSRIFQIAGGKAKAVPVTVLLSSKDGDVVDGKIDPNLPIIVDGAYQVQDGDAVRGK